MFNSKTKATMAEMSLAPISATHTPNTQAQSLKVCVCLATNVIMALTALVNSSTQYKFSTL